MLGDAIRVIYKDMVDDSTYKEINEDLIVLLPALHIDASGLRTHKLLVSNVNRQPVSDVEVLAKQLGRVASVRAYPHL